MHALSADQRVKAKNLFDWHEACMLLRNEIKFD